jgi:hypothetical protein
MDPHVPPPKLAYTIKQAVAATGISREKLYLMRREGALEMFKWGGRTLIREDVLRTAIDKASGRLPTGG